MPSYTIIVPDSSYLARICGTNDSNLKLMESFLGVPVFARGNELSIEDIGFTNEELFHEKPNDFEIWGTKKEQKKQKQLI